MSNIIVTLLDQAAEKRSAAEAVKAEIAALAGELVERQAALEKEAKDLVEQAKDKARFIPVEQRHTLIGRLLQLVWNPATVERRLDEGKVAALLAEKGIDPALLEGCLVEIETRKAHWAERKVGKGR